MRTFAQKQTPGHDAKSATAAKPMAGYSVQRRGIALRPQSQRTNGDRASGQPLDAMTRASHESLFGYDFSKVRIHTDSSAAQSAAVLGARAYTDGPHVVFGEGQYAPATRAGRQLLAHELTHVLQGRGRDPIGDGVASTHSAAEAEAARASGLVRAGLPPGSIRGKTDCIALTPASAAIEPLISHGFLDWEVTPAEEAQVLTRLRADPTLSATITDLHASGMLKPLIDRVDEAGNRFALLRLLGGRLTPTARALVEPHVRALGPQYELQFNLGRLGVPSTATAFNTAPYASLIGSSKSAPFTGVGATGVNPTTLDVPLLDEALLAAGHAGTTAQYSNPIPGSLPGYLATLTPAQRIQQAELLLGQPVSSVASASYAGNVPSRADVFKAAGAANNLEPALVAGFILAEQRDQSMNEDAKDYEAAASILSANTSIGLGQVVVSTARRGDLFQDLLSSPRRGGLGHDDIAMLLASDEYNIFAAARYIRRVADDGSTRPIASLPNTQARFPAIDMAAYAAHSSTWPADNIRALGSEYTSRAWDDVLVPGWGDFVLEAYHDVKGSGVL